MLKSSIFPNACPHNPTETGSKVIPVSGKYLVRKAKSQSPISKQDFSSSWKSMWQLPILITALRSRFPFLTLRWYRFDWHNFDSSYCVCIDPYKHHTQSYIELWETPEEISFPRHSSNFYLWIFCHHHSHLLFTHCHRYYPFVYVPLTEWEHPGDEYAP